MTKSCDKIKIKIIGKSFKKCSISNAIDRTEEEIYKDGDLSSITDENKLLDESCKYFIMNKLWVEEESS